MHQNDSVMPKTLSAENKRLYKKSLAKMMIFWIINTRRPLLERLLDSEANDLWKQSLPHLASAFRDNEGNFEDGEWNEFFELARNTVQNEFMQLSLNKMNDKAFETWVQRGPDGELIDLDCPSDEAFDLMFKAFADRVDALAVTGQAKPEQEQS